MTEAPNRVAVRQVDVADERDAEDEAWYLYGIIRTPRPRQEQPGNGSSGTRASLGTLMVGGMPLQVVEQGDLAAVVKPVSRREFTAESLEERLRDPAALEAMAHAHNEVIAAVHGQQAILPAKLGGVYADLDEVRLALAPMHDALCAQLERVEGCDEWAVHVRTDRAAVRQRLAAEHPGIRQLQVELKTARPGRAYFLQRKLAADLAAATRQTLEQMAQEAYDRLVRLAAAGQVNPSARSASADEGEIEILHAAFLVPRTQADTFLGVVDALAAAHGGVRCEYSGPWPPYSFAAAEQP